MTDEERSELEASLGHCFRRSEDLDHALTHRSLSNNGAGIDNERLEFLGDRVLGLVASDRLCRLFPDWEAGDLSRGLARLVSATAIYSAAGRLHLGRYLRLGPGEEKTGGREKKRLLADAYEAIVGAIYLDAGLEAATGFLRRTLIDPALSNQPGKVALASTDYKSALQEWAQRRGLPPVEYRVGGESGPDHQKTFEVEVWHEGKRLSVSSGRSKKEAEQSAAQIALKTLECRARPVEGMS
ncbi:MAG: ribonuclease III [Candidatus Acidiferrales bacterium]